MNSEITVIRLQVSGSRSDAVRLFTLLEKLERAGKIEPGAIADAWVLHDEWCAVLHGSHLCNCNPAIEISVRNSFGLDGEGSGQRSSEAAASQEATP